MCNIDVKKWSKTEKNIILYGVSQKKETNRIIQFKETTVFNEKYDNRNQQCTCKN